MGKKILSGIMLALLAATILSFMPSASATIAEVKIGWSMPLSGPVSPVAKVHHLYYWMVIDDFNKIGGLYLPEAGKRVPITYLALDDEYDDETMWDNYVYLITEWGAHLLFAPWSTAHNVYVLPLFEEYEYPVVGLTVGSNWLQDYLRAQADPWFFVTLGQPREDAAQLQAVIAHINARVPDALKIRKVGIAFRDDEHGIEHAEALKDGLMGMGISVPVDISYSSAPGATIDWAAIVGAFRAAGVDGCIVCGYDEVAGFVWQCIKEDYNPKFIVHGPALETSFLVYGPMGFTPGLMAGLMYYNGFPATAYESPLLYQWYLKHRAYTVVPGVFPHGYPPFPASAVFYAGVECLLRAAEKYGLNRPAIRAALEDEVFTITLGLPSPVGTLKFRKGESPIVAGFGTITQWQGGEMMEVIWPPASASTEYIVYPKPPWSWAAVLTDFNRDCKVDMKDIIFVIGKFGTKPCMLEFQPWYDVNSDNKVDLKDIILTIADFGKKAPYGGTVKL